MSVHPNPEPPAKAARVPPMARLSLGAGLFLGAGLGLSAAMLLEWLGGRHSRDAYLRAAKAIERAVDTLLEKPATRTRDLGGALGTRQFAAAVAERVLGEPGAR